jgi:hypothetical protein
LEEIKVRIHETITLASKACGIRSVFAQQMDLFEWTITHETLTFRRMEKRGRKYVELPRNGNLLLIHVPGCKAFLWTMYLPDKIVFRGRYLRSPFLQFDCLEDGRCKYYHFTFVDFCECQILISEEKDGLRSTSSRELPLDDIRNGLPKEDMRDIWGEEPMAPISFRELIDRAYEVSEAEGFLAEIKTHNGQMSVAR